MHSKTGAGTSLDKGKESCRALTEGGRTDPYAHKGEDAPEFIPEVGYSRSNNSVFIV